GAPMLWFLSAVMVGSGLVLVVAALSVGSPKRRLRSLLLYSVGAGAFQAVPQAMAYLSVAHVGAGYISLAFAFPLLVTYVLALMLGMERLSLARALGVAVALAGGLMLVLSKFKGLNGEAAVWVLVASAIPVVIAGGNLYRTRFWPVGADPLPLAALMLTISGLMVVPFAAGTEGTAGLGILWRNEELLLLAGISIAVFAMRFVTYFKLQHVAGPVYLSQIGTVGAAVATPIAVIFMGEVLPQNFAIAIALIVAGVALFEYGRRRQKNS
ncbi:MAG: DMT family transporter, partial [Proteobacteria bacterium]|nr:DMT family transporter [Pseudomonadota bacterium]